MSELKRVGTCEICGNSDVELYSEPDGYLPEEFEGVGCRDCIAVYREEGEKQDSRDFLRKMEDWEKADD